MLLWTRCYTPHQVNGIHTYSSITTTFKDQSIFPPSLLPHFRYTELTINHFIASTTPPRCGFIIHTALRTILEVSCIDQAGWPHLHRIRMHVHGIYLEYSLISSICNTEKSFTKKIMSGCNICDIWSVGLVEWFSCCGDAIGRSVGNRSVGLKRQMHLQIKWQFSLYIYSALLEGSWKEGWRFCLSEFSQHPRRM